MSLMGVIATVVILTFNIASLRYFAHVLQMERYHTDSFMTWAKGAGWFKGGGASRFYYRTWLDAVLHIVAFVSLFCIWYGLAPLPTLYIVLAIALANWMAACGMRRAKPKKKFSMTPRMMRLFAFVFIIWAVVIPQPWTYGEDPFIAVFAFMGYIQFLLVAGANQFATKFELYLQKSFIRQAHEKLEGKKVIAVTGSYGKTGVKEAIAHLLETTHPLLKTPGSFNTPMGLCKIINEKMEPHHELFVTEMGATRPGDIMELCSFCPPDIGVITSTGTAHLESFRTEENIARTKFELADALAEDGVLIINNDYKAVRQRAEDRPQKVVTYGAEVKSHFMPQNIRCGRSGSTFDLATPDGTIENITIKLLGRLNVLNVTAAFAVGHLLGVEPSKMKAAIASLPPMEARLQLLENPGSYLVINDGFNSNPVGASAAVETLGYFDGYRKILVTPGIVDLGKMEKDANREFGATAAKYVDTVLLINERRTKPLREGLLEGGMDEAQIKTFPSLEKAREFLATDADEKCVVLFENDLPDHMEDY